MCAPRHFSRWSDRERVFSTTVEELRHAADHQLPIVPRGLGQLRGFLHQPSVFLVPSDACLAASPAAFLNLHQRARIPESIRRRSPVSYRVRMSRGHVASAHLAKSCAYFGCDRLQRGVEDALHAVHLASTLPSATESLPSNEMLSWNWAICEAFRSCWGAKRRAQLRVPDPQRGQMNDLTCC